MTLQKPFLDSPAAHMRIAPVTMGTAHCKEMIPAVQNDPSRQKILRNRKQAKSHPRRELPGR